ncbi:MAG: hypothetical protein HOP15_02750 [Planctomycetes bacterium]|nr:hypothetical protein [Planctomycetota bacterium]
MYPLRTFPIGWTLAILGTLPLASPQRGGGGGGGGGGTPPADATVAFRKDGRLCLARADGSGQTVIGSLTIDGTIAWAPGGGPLFFQAPSPNGIFRIQPDGTGQTKVVSLVAYHTGISVTRGAPCPDGEARIFYTDGTSLATDLWSARLDGTGRVRLSANPSGVRYTSPTVAPSGDHVVVRDDIDLRLLTLGLVGGQLAVVDDRSLIADDPGHPMNPWVEDWFFFNPWFEDFGPANPAGTRLLFRAQHMVDSVPVSDGIYRMAVTAPALVELLPLSQATVGGPVTTASGLQVYYVSLDGSNRGTIYRCNADGTGSVRWVDPGRRGDHKTPCTRP